MVRLASNDLATIRRLGGYVLMACFLISTGCSLKTVDTSETGDKTTAKSKVLIATQKSRFKDEVVSEIKKVLDDKVKYIKVVDVKWLPNESVDNYRAIVIINACMAGRPDPRVESFIDTIQDKKKLVVLTTGRLDSWKPDSPEVDAITSASSMSESGVVARRIADKVLAIIKVQEKI
jgi:hypothetical protein